MENIDLTFRLVEVVLVVIFLIAAVAAAMYLNSYRKRLCLLAAAAAKYTEGDRSVSFEVTGPAEVEDVSRALVNMSNVINEALENLKHEERRQIQFVSDVSHELRTPLTAIRGAAETLLDGDVPAEDQHRFLTTIGSEAGRLTRLANDLLTLQRIEGATGELPVRRVDLRKLVEGVAASMEHLLEDRQVTLEIVGSAPAVLGDVDRLHQVVSNLVDNASRHVDENDGRVRVELTHVDGKSVLSVIDNGSGIPEADLRRLFDRFYRADAARTRSQGGTGLGLSIVRAIVTAHGGSVEALNLPGNGACFIVRLPALSAEVEPRPGQGLL